MHNPDREPQYDANAEAGILALAEKPNLENQRGAAYCLGDVIAPGPATLQALLRLCASAEEQTAMSALHSVAQITGRFRPAPVEELLEATRAQSPRVREAAVHGMGNLSGLSDGDRERCAARIIELLSDPDTRAAALENIGFFSQYRERFTPVLLQLMKGEMPNRAREAAIQSFGNAYLNDPPVPREVIESARAAMSHSDPGVQAIAKWAVACLERPPTPPPVERPKLSVVEAKRRLAELNAHGRRTVLAFFAAALIVVVAIVAAFFSPPIAVLFAVAGATLFTAWRRLRRQSPASIELIEAQLALNRAMIDDVKGTFGKHPELNAVILSRMGVYLSKDGDRYGEMVALIANPTPRFPLPPDMLAELELGLPRP